MLRKGITPVVAVVLLLMMTVAAAGAFYAFTEGIIGDQQDETRQQLNTELTVQGAQCWTNGTFALEVQNTGETTVDASSNVDAFIYTMGGDLETSETGVSLTEIAPGDVESGWSVSITGAGLNSGQEYRYELTFNNNDYTLSTTCQT